MRSAFPLLIAAVSLPILATAQGPALPPGFTDSAVVSGLAAPTAIAFAPDGRLFVCEKGGRVLVYKNGALLPAPFLQRSVRADSERGLLGIAFDPDFAANSFVYVYYTTPGSSPKNRVSRFTASGDTAVSGSEHVLVDGIPSDAGNHNAGCVRFGPDGKLYVSTGDGGSVPTNSQNLSNLAGKILRINNDGSIPGDNPFAGQGGRRGEIYCYGLRNPFRFCFRPSSGALYIADVGQNTWEEVNVGQAGGNYGWPEHEGPSNAAGFISPVHAYNHNGSGASITGGCFIEGTNYPAEYQGSYLFGDYVDGTLGRLTFGGDERLIASFPFGPADGPVDFAMGPDGDVYYVSINSGSVRRLRHSATPNQPPIARSGATTATSGLLPLTVGFSSAGSSDPDADPLTYAWSFGDGGSSSIANPTHTYSSPGTFTVTLTVSDGRSGSTEADPIVVHAGNRAPTVTINSPTDESRYRAGDAVAFGGGASDPEDGALAPAALQWKVWLYHADHRHPFLEFPGVASGSFTIPRSGEPSADTWYELVLKAIDSGGIETSRVIQIRPRKVALTFKTSPSGLNVTFNGQPHRTPVTLESVVGFDHLVGAPSPQVRGKTWSWRSWSDRGAQEHVIRAPSGRKTYAARFKGAR